MKYLFTCLLLLGIHTGYAQELYVYSEPASNMPAKSISAKLATSIGDRGGKTAMQRYTPEIMFGINKNLMIHGAATFSNMHTQNVAWESVYLYSKYRFLSKDEVHSHFRMAAFAEGGYSRNPVVFDELNVQGDVSGVQAGLIATQLQHKLAVSGTVSYTRGIYDEKKVHHANVVDQAMNYTLSAGYLVLPREYTSYNQLNFNVYTEFLAQHAIGDPKTYFIDAAPAIQFIFNSNSKLNLGYRFQLKGNASRGMQRSFLVSFEHTFFNALRKRKSD